MPNTVKDWTEDDVLALPAGESDLFERKGSRLLDLTLPGVTADDVYNELAKQLSAFSNAAGGQIIYGVADDGIVDSGGVALVVKGRQPTKEWLEDVIPKLTELEILGFNVYEIKPKSAGSQIAASKALFVVEVPASDRAPHQSTRDWKYYVRLGGRSQPAPHRMIEDIRNRQKHPLLQISRIWLQILGKSTSGAGVTTVRTKFDVFLKNISHIIAQNTCLQFEDPGSSVTWCNWDNSAVRPRGHHINRIFWELLDPIYPGMEIGFWVEAALPVSYVPPEAGVLNPRPWLVDGKLPSEVRLAWSIFADNAPTQHGVFTMEELRFEELIWKVPGF